MRMRRCSGLSTNISPPSDQNAWPPKLASGSWSSRITRRPASASSAVATRPASPAPTTMTSASIRLRAGGCSTRRISASAARPTSSWRSSGSRVPTTRWISKPGRRIARAVRDSLLRSHQAKTSTAAAVEASATALPASGPGRSTTLAQQQRAGDVGGQHRRDQVRAAAVVLLVGVGRVGGVVGRLVGGDRLVLDAVVLGQLAAAQREHGRGERDHRGGGLAARAAHAPAQLGAAERRRGRDADHGRALERELGGGQRALDERDHRERLAEAHDAAHARDAVDALHARLAARRRPGSRRRGRARRPPSGSGRARAGRCAAPSRRGGACLR